MKKQKKEFRKLIKKIRRKLFVMRTFFLVWRKIEKRYINFSQSVIEDSKKLARMKDENPELLHEQAYKNLVEQVLKYALWDLIRISEIIEAKKVYPDNDFETQIFFINKQGHS